MPSINQTQLLATLEKFRAEAAKGDAVALRQLAAAYKKIYQRLSDELELEVRRIWESDNPSRIYIAKRLSDLFEHVTDELQKYQSILRSTVDIYTDESLSLGTKHAVELMKLATLGQVNIIGIDFNKLPRAAIETMAGFLSPGSPLFKRIDLLAKYHASLVREKLIEAIALGYNPYKTAGQIAPFLADIAKTFQILMARPLADAVRLARTAQIWAYRESNRANYQANGDVVTGWTWFANLDDLVCPACISMHGTIHPIDEPLDGHYNCRCTPVPVVLGNPLVAEGAGLAWFEKQDTATQQGILGKGAYEAWQEGKFTFDQLAKQVDDDVYGKMRVVTPLKELVQ